MILILNLMLSLKKIADFIYYEQIQGYKPNIEQTNEKMR